MDIPSIETLQPREYRLSNGGLLHYFPSQTTQLVRADILFEAGSAYQSQLLCAAATCKLLTVATRSLDSAHLSEYMDYRGVVMETGNELFQSTITLYFLRRYAQDVVRVLDEMVTGPAYSDDDLRVWQNRRRQELAALEQRSSHIARRLLNRSIYGENHPLGWYATADDVLRLTSAAIADHFHSHYGNRGVVLAGAVDDEMLELFGHLQSPVWPPANSATLPAVMPSGAAQMHRCTMADSVQTSIRIGRLLPLTWDSMDYAYVMILTTVLGGYFGSRLMSNIREDKGLAYGIYARTIVYRGAIEFFIAADVAGGTADEAVKETLAEIERLTTEEIPDEELTLVRTVMVGDFLRSIDGCFELQQRYCDMLGSWATDQLTTNLRQALATCTPALLRQVAARYLSVDQMTVCLAGA